MTKQFLTLCCIPPCSTHTHTHTHQTFRAADGLCFLAPSCQFLHESLLSYWLVTYHRISCNRQLPSVDALKQLFGVWLYHLTTATRLRAVPAIQLTPHISPSILLKLQMFFLFGIEQNRFPNVSSMKQVGTLGETRSQPLLLCCGSRGFYVSRSVAMKDGCFCW